jgi:hypothetical protein
MCLKAAIWPIFMKGDPRSCDQEQHRGFSSGGDTPFNGGEPLYTVFGDVRAGSFADICNQCWHHGCGKLKDMNQGHPLTHVQRNDLVCSFSSREVIPSHSMATPCSASCFSRMNRYARSLCSFTSFAAGIDMEGSELPDGQVFMHGSFGFGI